jgi:hypothetical protein
MAGAAAKLPPELQGLLAKAVVILCEGREAKQPNFIQRPGLLSLQQLAAGTLTTFAPFG